MIPALGGPWSTAPGNSRAGESRSGLHHMKKQISMGSLSCGQPMNMVCRSQRVIKITNINGRGYKLNKDGVLRFFTPEAFNETIKCNLEHENYLSRLSVYLLGGDSLMTNVFGDDLLEHCKPRPKGEDQMCNGLRTPAGLAEQDCTPSILRLFDPSMKEYLKGSAKLRAILSTYPVVPLGDLPDWNMGFKDAGEKGTLNDVREADARGAAPKTRYVSGVTGTRSINGLS